MRRLHAGLVGVVVALQVVLAQGAEPELLDLKVDRLEIVNRTATITSGEVHLDGAPGAGMAWIKGLDVNQGCIALEVRGSNEQGRSFVGLAFRGADNGKYDSVYLRPFVFQSDDPAKSANAIQYMSVPDFEWPVLRQRSPGVYEKSIGSRPSPDSWVELIVKFEGGKLRAFADGSKTPQLELPLLTQTTAGRVALWVGNNSSGSFRKIRRCS